MILTFEATLTARIVLSLRTTGLIRVILGRNAQFARPRFHQVRSWSYICV